MFEIDLDREGEENLYRQIYQQIKAEILEDRYTPDSKMPSIRKLAARLNVNSETVVKAYNLLAEEFLIYKKEGSGSYIAPAAGYKAGKNDQRLRMLSSKDSSGKRIIDFSGVEYNKEYMPEYAFDLILDRFYSKFEGDIFNKRNSREYKWYNFLEKIENKYEHQALYYSSASQIIDILTVLIKKDDLLLFESPSEMGAFSYLLEKEVAAEENNINQADLLKLKEADYEVLMDYLQENKIDFLILNDEPVLTKVLNWNISKLKSLFELAEMLKFKIIIKESYHLFTENSKLEELINSKYKNNLILIKELTKKVFPGLELGIILLPGDDYNSEESTFRKYLLKNKYQFLSAGEELIENVLSYYLAKSYLDKRTKLLKQRIKNRNLLLREELNKNFRNIEVKSQGSAYFSILYLEKNLDQKTFQKFAEKNGILLANYKNFLVNKNSHKLILSTACLDQFSIKQGVMKLAKIYRQFLT